MSVTPGAVGQGVRVDTDGPAYAAARAAMHEDLRKPAQEIGAGGSIPLIDSLRAAVPGAEILLFGAQDPMARIHAPNEVWIWRNWRRRFWRRPCSCRTSGLSKDR